MWWRWRGFRETNSVGPTSVVNENIPDLKMGGFIYFEDKWQRYSWPWFGDE